MKYTSKDRLKSGLPLGGIGAGKIEILPNGGLDFFTVANNLDSFIAAPTAQMCLTPIGTRSNSK